MTKSELNEKLAELYNLPAKKAIIVDLSSTSITGDQKDIYTTSYALLIDDWDILMKLAVDNGINYVCYKHYGYCKAWIGLREEDTSFAFVENLKDHESPQDAVMFSIAMALVKLKEVTV